MLIDLIMVKIERGLDLFYCDFVAVVSFAYLHGLLNVLLVLRLRRAIRIIRVSLPSLVVSGDL